MALPHRNLTQTGTVHKRRRQSMSQGPRRESTGAPRSHQRTWDENDGRSPTIAFSRLASKPRVPHISLVFREMWDTTAFNLRTSDLQNSIKGNRRVPHVRTSVRGTKTMGEAQQ